MHLEWTRGSAALTRSRAPGVGRWLLLILPAAACAPAVPTVPASGETDPVRSEGDAADDAAILVNGGSLERSVILATDKRAGVHVLSLSGRELQFVPVGEANNIDVRSDYPFPDGAAPLVAISNRSRNTITLLRFDEAAARLVSEPVGSIATGLSEPEEVYGVCLYRAAAGVFHAGVTSTGGTLQQWRLYTQEDGAISGRLVRSIRLGSKAEGCVFDDPLRRLYVGVEDAGLWRLPADPAADADTTRHLVDGIWPRGRLRPDVEGMDVYVREDGAGYLIVSSQGDDTFQAYRRDGDNEHVGGFRIGRSRDGAVDPVTHTDGLALTSARLSQEWPEGLLVVQDDRNTGPDQNQNFKLVSWSDVARVLRR